MACVAIPILDALPEAYLVDKIKALKSRRKANDITQQMRNLPLALTDQEITW